MGTHYTLPSIPAFTSTLNGKNTHLFVLKNRAGMQIALTDYGARLVSAFVPDKHGDLIDVVLGFNSIQEYLQAKEAFHGATIGRFANRIKEGKFEINGKVYPLPQNDGASCLHGGSDSFHTKVWDRQVNYATNRITFYLVSEDGENGFPGQVKISVSYELTDDNEIIITYRATSDQDTYVNLTNHTYFNLNGEGSDSIVNHRLELHSDSYLAMNEQKIPTGMIKPTSNSVFDFSNYKELSAAIHSDSIEGGIDHSFVTSGNYDDIVAQIYSPTSGVLLKVSTDYPTIHLYTANTLAEDIGKSGSKYGPHAGFCIEAQHYLDNPNQPSFPKSMLSPGQEYLYHVKYKFCIKR